MEIETPKNTREPTIFEENVAMAKQMKTLERHYPMIHFILCKE